MLTFSSCLDLDYCDRAQQAADKAGSKFFLTSNLHLPISGELAFRLFNNHSVRLTWNACLLTLEGCQVKSVDDWPVLRKDRLCCSVWPKARHHQGAFRNAEFQSPPLT